MKVQRVLVVIAACGVALSACSGASSAQTAATVGDRVITEEALLTATEQLNTALKPQQPITPNVVLSAMIRAPYINEAVAAQGQPVSESQAREGVATLAEPATPEVIEVLRAEANAQQLNETTGPQLTKKLRELRVSVNPRYGSYNPERFGVAPEVPNWLIPPAEGAQTQPSQ